MRESVRDRARLEHILQAISYVQLYTDGYTMEQFVADHMRRFAVIKNIEIVGEASYLLTKEFREANPQVPWRQIINMRHILVHGYCQIDDAVLWGTIKEDLESIQQKMLTQGSQMCLRFVLVGEGA